jgi:ribosomal protein S27AE
MARLLHMLGIHDWLPYYVMDDAKRMIRQGSICSVCGQKR